MRQKHIYSLLILVVFVSNAWGTGWNDYELDIGDGFSIIKANSLEICLAKSNGNVILLPSDFDSVGPIVGYFINNDVVLTKNAGRKRRNLFEGDTFEEVDENQIYYFIYEKSTSSLLGPYQPSKFQEVVSSRGINHLDWIAPKNPDFWRPTIIGLFFLAIAIPLLAVKYFYISVPIIAIGIFLVRSYYRKKRTEHGCAADR